MSPNAPQAHRRRLARGATALAALAATVPLFATADAHRPPGSNPANALTPAQVAEDTALLRETLERIHPGYERYTTPEARAATWTRLQAETGRGASPARLYLGVARLLATLRCEHTKAELPPALDAAKREGGFMPFRFRLFDGRMFVESAAPESGLVRGDEIDALDGRPVRELVSRLAPLVSVDGYTDHTRPQSLETDFDLLGSSFEQYYAFEVLGLDRWPSRVEIAWRDARGVAHRATRPTLAFDAWIALGDSPYRQNFGDAVSLSRPEEGIAVLRVETFVNYRQPVDADALLAPLFRKLKADGVTTLIVDLRDNGGGSDDAQIALMRHLYQRPFRLGGAAWAKTLDFEGLRAHLDTWNPAILEPDPAWFTEREGRHYVAPGIMGPAYAEQRPAPDAFEGRLLLLSSVRNASATAALLAAMAREPNVTVVGEPTGGNQGGTTASQIVFLKLPHSGITVRVPLLRAEPANPGAVDGQGVTPDVYVTPRLDDWRDGRDVVLERALELASRGLPAAD